MCFRLSCFLSRSDSIPYTALCILLALCSPNWVINFEFLNWRVRRPPCLLNLPQQLSVKPFRYVTLHQNNFLNKSRCQTYKKKASQNNCLVLVSQICFFPLNLLNYVPTTNLEDGDNFVPTLDNVCVYTVFNLCSWMLIYLILWQ